MHICRWPKRRKAQCPVPGATGRGWLHKANFGHQSLPAERAALAVPLDVHEQQPAKEACDGTAKH